MGQAKHKYHRRKMVWNLISILVHRGITAKVAIDWLYAFYGRAESVTTIKNKSKNNRRNGKLVSILDV